MLSHGIICHPGGMDDQRAPRIPPETPAESDPDSRWLSYRQIAHVRRISPASAARMARLHGWTRRKNNEGMTVCQVPLAYAEPDAEKLPENPPERPKRPTESPAESAAISALHSAVATLREALARAEQAAESERARADRAETSREAERSRVDALRDRVAALEVQAAQLEAEGEASDLQVAELTGQLRRAQEAVQAAAQQELARQGRGRWARLRSAWRGE